jgi:hypothetical protein
MDPDAPCRLPDAGADLEQAQADRVELGALELDAEARCRPSIQRP